jgi:hypothetical protein
MSQLDDIKKKKVKGAGGYYITNLGQMCYKTKEGKWMYCKKVDGKPGWVWTYLNGKLKEYNQTEAAMKYYPSSKAKVEFIKEKPTYELPKRKIDGRYKEGADAGVMSKSKPLLPLKPMSEIPKPIKVEKKPKLPNKNIMTEWQLKKMKQRREESMGKKLIKTKGK